MQIITVTKTASSNSFLKELHREHHFKNPVCVTVYEQTQGRGQKGALWQAKPYENLTFSILIPDINCPPEEHFKLNMAVALIIYDVLNSFSLLNLSLKWPNDIMADGKKIAGILIENTLSRALIKDTVIGIGLNVNQIEFHKLPKASSLKIITGKDYELLEVLQAFTEAFSMLKTALHSTSFDTYKERYEALLFRKNRVTVFQSLNAEQFNGIIQGINTHGQLLIETENDIKTFSLKEVSMQF